MPADSIVFIDDLPENLPAAEQLGIRTILFTGVEDLRDQLRRLGVLNN
jgi:methionine salvage enolase-phosphatase E1